MTTDTHFLIGAEVHSADGVLLGRLTRVIVDPVAEVLTHLVVESGLLHGGPARLVPVDLVVAQDAAATGIGLDCAAQAFVTMDEAVEAWFLPGGEQGSFGYHRGQVSSWPFYGLGAAVGADQALAVGAYAEDPEHGHYVVHDKVPAGETAIRRGEAVHAADGPIGHVAGLVVDPADYHVTHVLLREGHLWGQKQVATPSAP